MKIFHLNYFVISIVLLLFSCGTDETGTSFLSEGQTCEKDIILAGGLDSQKENSICDTGLICIDSKCQKDGFVKDMGSDADTGLDSGAGSVCGNGNVEESEDCDDG